MLMPTKLLAHKTAKMGTKKAIFQIYCTVSSFMAKPLNHEKKTISGMGILLSIFNFYRKKSGANIGSMIKHSNRIQCFGEIETRYGK
jgi:hypothetical protein